MLGRLLVFLLAAAVCGCTSGDSPEEKGRSADPQMVLDKTWQWISTDSDAEKIPAPSPERYTILLGKDGKLEGQFDCNSGGGSYTIGEGSLSFGPLFTTRMACPPDSLGSRFIEDLQKVQSFFVEDDALYLELEANSGTMHFRQVE